MKESISTLSDYLKPLYNFPIGNNKQIPSMKAMTLDASASLLRHQKSMPSYPSMKSLQSLQETPYFHPERFLLPISLDRTQEESRIYSWRSKTELPIVRVTSFSRKYSDAQNCLFEVEIEAITYKLFEMRQLPLFKIFYMLKEALVGFEKLYREYGGFLVTSKMIGLNNYGKCKVWLSENYSSNQGRSNYADQAAFLASILRLFELGANKNKKSLTFFDEVKASNTFCSALSFLQSFERINKMCIQTVCLLSAQQIFHGERKNMFDVTRTMSKAPKSLNNEPLRTTFKHKSSYPLPGMLNNFAIKQNAEQQGQQTIYQLKRSQETAAELNDKKSNGLSCEDHFYLQSVLLDGGVDELLAKSQFQPMFKSKAAVTRKFSEQYPEVKSLGISKEISPFSQKKIESKCKKPKWNENTFTNCEFQSQQNGIDTTFSNNKWQKKLNGLFHDQNLELKVSMHTGQKQKCRCDSNEINLSLLDKYGKTLQESFINQEMQSFEI